VRTTAVLHLWGDFADHPPLRPWLMRRVADDRDDVRWAALKALTRRDGDDPDEWVVTDDLLPLLVRTAQQDPGDDVRRLAALALTHASPRRVDVRTWARKTAAADVDPAVRAAAVMAFARCVEPDPKLLSWLRKQAPVDTDAAVGASACALRPSGSPARRRSRAGWPVSRCGRSIQPYGEPRWRRSPLRQDPRSRTSPCSVESRRLTRRRRPLGGPVGHTGMADAARVRPPKPCGSCGIGMGRTAIHGREGLPRSRPAHAAVGVTARRWGSRTPALQRLDQRRPWHLPTAPA
jgi:hypothetical protein